MNHGGDIESYIEKYGRKPLDFSASVSPLGMPRSVKDAASYALLHTEGYPDPYCRSLRREIAERHSIEPDQIVCTNGASDLITRLAFRMRKRQVLLPSPFYTEYEHAFRNNGCRVKAFRLKEEDRFTMTEEVLDHLSHKPDVLILCQPMNPSGTVCSKELLRRIAEECARNHVLIVADECFIDFLDDPDVFSLIHEQTEADVLLIRAFTKFYGMAPLRLGYGVSRNKKLIRKLFDAGSPWMVSSPAMAAGIAALRDEGYERMLRSVISEERTYLKESLKLLGCSVIPSEANFLMFRPQNTDLSEELAKRGILIRGLEDMGAKGWYRIAVRLHPENERLINAMKEVGP